MKILRVKIDPYQYGRRLLPLIRGSDNGATGHRRDLPSGSGEIEQTITILVLNIGRTEKKSHKHCGTIIPGVNQKLPDF